MRAMTAEEWIAAFAAELGVPAPDEGQTRALLELASVAAHASERRAAPIACWLAAIAGTSPQDARAVAQGVSAE